MRPALFLVAALLPLAGAVAAPPDGNRLAYLDESDPYYVGRNFPKLITPQWVGEEGVEAVVVLAIDDMRGPAKWEAYLRPILERLKQIDGRAPVSIMTCQIDPADPHLQDVAQGRAEPRVSHVRSSLPAPQGRRLRQGQEHLRPLRRPDGPDSRQQAGGLPHAVLRFAEHAQPAVLGGDLQPDDAEREFPDDRFLGVQRLHVGRSRAAARAGARRGRRRTVHAATCPSTVRS